MKLLLDTHIWLWSLLAPNKLKRRVSKALDDDENELWLSPISVWESLIIFERGRVEISGDPTIFLRDALSASRVIEAPLTQEVAIQSRSISLPHRDPADRFIAATAQVYELTLVTADSRLVRRTEYSSLSN
ncbi:MAG: type II toxin-antitoxin system VapC family toxin [Gemmatimonadaceae bacterium]